MVLESRELGLVTERFIDAWTDFVNASWIGLLLPRR